MRIIRDSGKIRLPEDKIQRFFIQAWFSQVHMNSLDSHRVRCMNTLNIIDELMAFLATSKSKLPGIADDIVRTASEALEILSNDNIVRCHFGLHWQKLSSLLEKIKLKKPLPDVFIYYLREFQTELVNRYKGLVIDEIRQEVFHTKDERKLYAHIGALLSILIHEGHSIDELFAIIRDIFIANKSAKSFSFTENFNFMEGIIKRAPSSYDIIFKLRGCSRIDHLKKILGEKISRKLDLKRVDNNVKKFLSAGQNILFSKITVSARDDRSAGLLAKKELDSILDLIRFELEDRVISIDDNFISIRKDDDSARRFRLPTIVPNPKQIEPVHFEEFVTRFRHIFENGDLPLESKEKIRSALRFYRMGRDSDLFENKFLNWWTALEYLTRTGEKGSIIEEVRAKLIPTLLLHYLQKHLNSYKNALHFCSVSGIERQTTALELFSLIHSSAEFDALLRKLDDVPFLKFRLERFKTQTGDAAALGQFLKKHEEHLQWHIHRIWRIRCDIVHSAEYSLNLNLLSANLEYYLKSLLTLIIDEFALKRRIFSVDEFYTRYQYGYKRLKEEIKANNNQLHQLILSEAFL